MASFVTAVARRWTRPRDAVRPRSWREQLRALLLGTRTSYGLVFTTLLYLLLIAIGFVYLY